MIESWILLMLDPKKYPSEANLPQCARQNQATATQIYGKDPPPQLKDLLKAERDARKCDKDALALEAVSRLNASDLAKRSPSFHLFHTQVAEWAGSLSR
jgi:hypothetical protein